MRSISFPPRPTAVILRSLLRVFWCMDCAREAKALLIASKLSA